MIAKALVNHPEEVEVRSVEGQHLIVLELCVHPEDVGQVIGRYGRTHVCQPPRNDRSGHSHRARASRPQNHWHDREIFASCAEAHVGRRREVGRSYRESNRHHYRHQSL